LSKSESELTWKDLEIGSIVTEPGNASQYRTGDWRSQRPTYNFERCIKCGICYLFCPEGCIGQNADDAGLVDGLQLAVYDVSDMSNPVRTAHRVIGSGWSTTSEALYEHKAFQFYAPLGILSIPVHHWSWGPDSDEFFNGAMLFRIDELSITDFGEIDHNEFYTPVQGFWNWERQVKRSIFIGDENGFYIYTISGVGLKVNSIDDISIVAAAAELPSDWIDYWMYYWILE